MTLSRTYRFTALLMAFLLLLSTSGMTMDMHFCEGKLKRVNLFGTAKTCAEVAECFKVCHSKSKSKNSEKKSCHSGDGDHKGCCNNTGLLLDMDYDFGGLSAEFNPVQNKIFTSFLFENTSQKLLCNYKVPYLNYRPPLLTRDITVIIQSFLI